MNMSGDDRSVHAGGNISGVVQTGDYNRADLTSVALPDSANVDICAVLAELRSALTAVTTSDAAKVSRALDDAEEEAAKDRPDKTEVAGVLSRALGYVGKASDFAEHIEKIRPLIVQVAGWIGMATASLPLLTAVGLSAG